MTQAFGTGPGIRLSAAFFHEVVEPLADARLGRASYAAALLGGGSEVLGLDTDLSADHDWGPRVVLLVEPTALAEASSIERELPDSFGGVSRRFGAPAGGAPSVHPFEVSTVVDYFDAWIGFSDRSEATLVEWLARPSMSFLAVTAGAVFHDGPGVLRRARVAADWYPDEVWRWMIACQWRRIGEEQSFIERTTMAGDSLGARIILARVVRDAIRLAFLLERRYPPYSKWLGGAFGTLAIASELLAAVTTAMEGPGESGVRALGDALEVLGSFTNRRLDTDVDPSRRQYFSRPIQVAPAREFVEAVLATVAAPELKSLPTDIGNVDMLYGTNNGAAPAADQVYRALLLG